MDTLFRLVNLQTSDQHSSFNSSTHTNSSSVRSNQNHYQRYHHDISNYYDCFNSSSYDHHYRQQDQEQYQGQECGTNYHLYMHEDFSSSSSSKHFHGYPHYPPSSSTTTPTRSSATTPTAIPAFEPTDLSLLQDLKLDFSSPEPSSCAPTVGASDASGGGRWASQLLLECARAVASHDSQRVQQLMWMLNELSSPYGDIDQKVAAYFLQGLFARLTLSGPRTLRTLSAASDRKCSFDSTRRTALRFQELSPWSSFGHVAANGAILEAFLDSASSSSSGAQKFHIFDLSSTFCTQWPTLLEALATRSSDDTPHLSITTVVSSPSSTSTSSSVQKVMKEIGQRMEKFARLMGVPFRFNAIHHDGDLSAIDLDRLDLREGGDAILAVNCANALHTISPGGRRRDSFITAVRRLRPRIVTIVDEEADLEVEDGGDDEGETFLKGFRESLTFFTAFFESLEESFPRTSNERMALERAAGRAVVDLVSCPASGSSERRQTATGWSRRMRTAGFSPVAFSEDVSDDVRALLKRYREGWSMRTAEKAEDSGARTGIFLAWKEHPVVWASAWTA